MSRDFDAWVRESRAFAQSSLAPEERDTGKGPEDPVFQTWVEKTKESTQRAQEEWARLEGLFRVSPEEAAKVSRFSPLDVYNSYRDLLTPEQVDHLVRVYTHRATDPVLWGAQFVEGLTQAPAAMRQFLDSVVAAAKSAARIVRPEVGTRPENVHPFMVAMPRPESDARESSARQQGVAEAVAGAETALVSWADLARKLARKALVGTPAGFLTWLAGQSISPDTPVYRPDITAPETLARGTTYRDQFFRDAAIRKRLQQISQGQGWLAEALGLSAEALEQQGITLDPEAIAGWAVLVDPANVLGAVAGVRVARLRNARYGVLDASGRKLAEAPTEAGARQVAEKLTERVSKFVKEATPSQAPEVRVRLVSQTAEAPPPKLEGIPPLTRATEEVAGPPSVPEAPTTRKILEEILLQTSEVGLWAGKTARDLLDRMGTAAALAAQQVRAHTPKLGELASYVSGPSMGLGYHEPRRVGLVRRLAGWATAKGLSSVAALAKSPLLQEVTEGLVEGAAAGAIWGLPLVFSGDEPQEGAVAAVLPPTLGAAGALSVRLPVMAAYRARQHLDTAIWRSGISSPTRDVYLESPGMEALEQGHRALLQRLAPHDRNLVNRLRLAFSVVQMGDRPVEAYLLTPQDAARLAPDGSLDGKWGAVEWQHVDAQGRQHNLLLWIVDPETAQVPALTHEAGHLFVNYVMTEPERQAILSKLPEEYKASFRQEYLSRSLTPEQRQRLEQNPGLLDRELLAEVFSRYLEGELPSQPLARAWRQVMLSVADALERAGLIHTALTPRPGERGTRGLGLRVPHSLARIFDEVYQRWTSDPIVRQALEAVDWEREANRVIEYDVATFPAEPPAIAPPVTTVPPEEPRAVPPARQTQVLEIIRSIRKRLGPAFARRVEEAYDHVLAGTATAADRRIMEGIYRSVGLPVPWEGEKTVATEPKRAPGSLTETRPSSEPAPTSAENVAQSRRIQAEALAPYQGAREPSEGGSWALRRQQISEKAGAFLQTLDSRVELTPETKQAVRLLLEELRDAFAQRRAPIAFDLKYRGARHEGETPPQRAPRRAEIESARFDPALREVALKLASIPLDVRETKQGRLMLQFWSAEKLLGNLYHALQLIKKAGLEAEFPYPLREGQLTPEGAKQLAEDLLIYTANQYHGYRGDGRPLIRPPDFRGFIPPEDPSYVPRPLSSERALDVCNLLMGEAPPLTPRITEGIEPIPVRARKLAQATEPSRGVPAIPLRQYEREPYRGQIIYEHNPLRHLLTQRLGNEAVRTLTEVHEWVRAEEILSAQPRPDLLLKPTSTDVTAAGFLPASRDSELLYGLYHTSSETRNLLEQLFRQAGYAPRGLHTGWAPVHQGLADTLKQWYQEVTHAPSEPAVQTAYSALRKELVQHYQALTEAGYVIELPDRQFPYQHTGDLIRDAAQKRVVVPQRALVEYGVQEPQLIPEDHPLAQIAPVKDARGNALTYADVLSAVSAILGHATFGAEYGLQGRWNAALLYGGLLSDAARQALVTELLARPLSSPQEGAIFAPAQPWKAAVPSPELVREIFRQTILRPGALVHIRSAQSGRVYPVRFDGWQDFGPLGYHAQFTALADLEGRIVKGSSTYTPTLAKYGFEVPEIPPPTNTLETASYLPASRSRVATLEDFENPQRLSLLPHLGGWAILSANQTKWGPPTSPQNQQATQQLRAFLQAQGIPHLQLEGRYKGEPIEVSFALTGISPQKAVQLGKQFQQESVLVPQGLLYTDGSLTPIDPTQPVLVGAEAEAQDFYSKTPQGVAFTLPLWLDVKWAPQDWAWAENLRVDRKILKDLPTNSGERYEATLPLSERARRAARMYKYFGVYPDAQKLSLIPTYAEWILNEGAALAEILPAQGKLLEFWSGDPSTIVSLAGARERDPIEVALFGAPEGLSIPIPSNTVRLRPLSEIETDLSLQQLPTEQYHVIRAPFISGQFALSRLEFVRQLRSRLSPEGLLLLSEKVLLPPTQWQQNETFSTLFHRQRYLAPQHLRAWTTEGAYTQLALEALHHPVEELTSMLALEAALSAQFPYVVQYWDAGNYRGYVASMNLAAIQRFLQTLGPLRSRFTKVQVPRAVTAAAQFLPKESPDAIKAAAVRTVDGRIYTGAAHALAYLAYLADTEKRAPETITDQEMWAIDLEEGFVTYSGQFLSREAAAARANQLKQGSIPFAYPLEAVTFQSRVLDQELKAWRKKHPNKEEAMIWVSTPERTAQWKIVAQEDLREGLQTLWPELFNQPGERWIWTWQPQKTPPWTLWYTTLPTEEMLARHRDTLWLHGAPDRPALSETLLPLDQWPEVFKGPQYLPAKSSHPRAVEQDWRVIVAPVWVTPQGRVIQLAKGGTHEGYFLTPEGKAWLTQWGVEYGPEVRLEALRHGFIRARKYQNLTIEVGVDFWKRSREWVKKLVLANYADPTYIHVLDRQGNVVDYEFVHLVREPKPLREQVLEESLTVLDESTADALAQLGAQTDPSPTRRGPGRIQIARSFSVDPDFGQYLPKAATEVPWRQKAKAKTSPEAILWPDGTWLAVQDLDTWFRANHEVLRTHYGAGWARLGQISPTDALTLARNRGLVFARKDGDVWQIEAGLRSWATVEHHVWPNLPPAAAVAVSLYDETGHLAAGFYWDPTDPQESSVYRQQLKQQSRNSASGPLIWTPTKLRAAREQEALAAFLPRARITEITDTNLLNQFRAAAWALFPIPPGTDAGTVLWQVLTSRGLKGYELLGPKGSPRGIFVPGLRQTQAFNIAQQAGLSRFYAGGQLFVGKKVQPVLPQVTRASRGWRVSAGAKKAIQLKPQESPRPFELPVEIALIDPAAADLYPEAVIAGPKERIPYRLRGAPIFDGLEEAQAIQRAADLLERDLLPYRESELFQQGRSWYTRATTLLQEWFGETWQLFVELLAATSPRTTVAVNWRYATIALREYLLGNYDRQIDLFLKGLSMLENQTLLDWYRATIPQDQQIGEPTPQQLLATWIHYHDLIPKQPSGASLGMAGLSVLKVLARRWLQDPLVGTEGLKVQQFAKNLLGTDMSATIDVWAARWLRRVFYAPTTERWRILPANEITVTDEDFRFAQAAIAELARRWQMTPAEVQGGAWFIEKQRWALAGWAPAQYGDYAEQLRRMTQQPELPFTAKPREPTKPLKIPVGPKTKQLLRL